MFHKVVYTNFQYNSHLYMYLPIIFNRYSIKKEIDQCNQALRLLLIEGMTVLLVEQNTERALATADDVCVLESGATVWKGSATDARNDPKLAAAYLGLH